MVDVSASSLLFGDLAGALTVEFKVNISSLLPASKPLRGNLGSVISKKT
jgi:hypothetical protein